MSGFRGAYMTCSGILHGTHASQRKKCWAEYKRLLPAHFGVYLTQVGPLKAAAANVETVFSGAGKFTEEARSTGAVLLR